MLTSAANTRDVPDIDSVTRDPRIPKPVGHKLLVMVPTAEEKTRGGILLPDKERDLSQTASPVVYVVALGPDAYDDHRRFPSGPRCAAGQWVIVQSFSGSRMKIKGDDGIEYEFRLINDDAVQATVEDPSEIRKA
jgi:co-chaperonin GroES (HSP10)